MDKLPISGTTKLVALLGSPVQHSQSPKMHNASFAQLGIDARYLVFDVDVEKLPLVVPALGKMGIVGFNVTMPCKMAIMDYLDELSDSARLIGAVNTVAYRDNKSYGDNTDGRGFWQNCRDCGFEVLGKKVLVLGAGGAGSAVFIEAALEGAQSVSVFNRRGTHFDTACLRAKQAESFTSCPIELTDLANRDALKEAVEACDIVVNCTRVGMVPDQFSSLIPQEWMRQGLTVADTVYNPRETKMICDAKALGLSTVPGLGMLLWQGALAEEIWFPGAHMDVAAIKELLF